MPDLTVTHQLLSLLKKNGVNTLYGVTGDTVFPFFDGLTLHPEIRYIATSNETSAAFMAAYQAKLTGEIGVCIATSGPGTANLVNGLADAYFDSAPVLAITGQVSSSKMGTGAKQDINQQKLLQAVTFSSQLVSHSKAVLPVVARALEQAVYGKTVTHVSIPEDIFSQSLGPELPAIDSRTLANKGLGFSGNLEAAVNSLQNSQKPLIVVGLAERNLREPLQQLADVLGAAVIVAQQAKGSISEKHPRVLGGIGEAHIPNIFGEADCILQIGTASYEKKFIPSNVETIQLVENMGSFDYNQVNIGIMGNILDIVTEVLAQIKPKQNEDWDKKIACEKDVRQRIIAEQLQNTNSPIHPAHLMAVLNQAVPDDAIIVCDIGGYVHWFDSYFQAEEQTVLISSHWRSMGSGLPGALGAALHSDNKVFALVGDGGLMMSLSELATAAKYQIPVTIVVANNHIYELEKVRMQQQGLNPMGVDIFVPDLAAVAREFGIHGVRVEKADTLETALQECLQIQGPFHGPYPYPEREPISANSQIFREGCEALGIRSVVAPLAILSAPFDGRPPCTNRGFCNEGCTPNAKFSTLIQHVPKAIKHGAEILSDSMVTQILVNDEGRATGVEFVHDGKHYRQKAKIVLVTAYGVETPRLLLNSACPQFPDGLANSSGTVGKYIMVHSSHDVFAKFDEEIRLYKGTPVMAITQDFYQTELRRGFVRGYQLNAHGNRPVKLARNLAVDAGYWGKELRDIMLDYNFYGQITLVGEVLADANNAVSLSDEKDEYGLPRAEITFSYGENDNKIIAHGIRKCNEIFVARGGKPVFSFADTGHFMGGCRMGSDPAKSVVNSYGKSHDIPNLFISGAPIFVTGGGTNPTETVMALAARTAEHLIDLSREGKIARQQPALV